ncbi:MAG: hypothetical protein AABO58_07820 [Acidobacteriota bacterium]
MKEMKRRFFTLSSVLGAASAYAENVTQSVLEAKLLKEFIRIKLLKRRWMGPSPEPPTRVPGFGQPSRLSG